MAGEEEVDKKDKPKGSKENAGATGDELKPNARPPEILIVTTTQDGFRRAGREWHGSTEVSTGEFSEEQLEQLSQEPKLHIIAKPA